MPVHIEDSKLTVKTDANGTKTDIRKQFNKSETPTDLESKPKFRNYNKQQSMTELSAVSVQENQSNLESIKTKLMRLFLNYCDFNV